jgi:hypothetical protein
VGRPIEGKLLRIYLNDHRAGAVAGVSLAKRTQANNRGTELGGYLSGLVEEVEEDLRALEDFMRVLQVPLNPFKSRAGWLAERLARGKLNGQLRGYSPLSRLLELEGLGLAVEGKKRLWISLKQIAENDPRLNSEQLEMLIERADRQLGDLEARRRHAVESALQR